MEIRYNILYPTSIVIYKDLPLNVFEQVQFFM